MATSPASATDSPDLRLMLPAITVWLGMWLVTGWAWGVWVVGVAAGIGGLAALVGPRMSQPSSTRFLSPPLVGVLAVMAASGAAIAGVRMASLEGGILFQAAGERRVAEVEVEIRSARLSPRWGMAVVNADVVQATIQGVSYSMKHPVVVLAPQAHADQWLGYPAGAVVAVSVRLGPAERADGVAAVLTPLDESRLIRPPPAWQRVIESMRVGLVEAMANSPPEQAALLPALVVGDTSAMSQQMLDDFQATGLTHLTAVSGANLAILLSFLSSIARRSGVRGRGLMVVSTLGIAVFVALCHAEPSVLRASAMGIVTLVSIGRGSGSGSGIRALCLAVIGLCWIDPWMSRSWGFILSVLACLGILWWGRRWSLVLARYLPGWMADAMAIPLAAQVATQPVVSLLSGQISISGLFANAAAGPWVAPATVVGLVAALVSPVSSTLALGAGYVAGWCAQPILLIGHWLADLPGASRPWPTTPVGLGLLVAGSLALGWFMPRLLKRVWMVALISSALVIALVSAPFYPGWPGQDWRIAACDVGQGDALAVRVDQGRAILIDVGPPGSGVVSCLTQLGISEIPVLVLTHLHADHAGALSELIDALPVGMVVAPEEGESNQVLQGVADDRGFEVVIGMTGHRTQIGDVELQIVSAYRGGVGAADGEESAAENDQSLVVRVDAPDMSLLATGDVEIAGQQAAMKDPRFLEVDVVKVPHHGSARQDQAFLEATNAQIGVVSVGADNGYGHPAARTVTTLVNAGMEVVRTDEHGSITIAHTDRWTITTQK